MQNEIIIFGVFSTVINFAYGIIASHVGYLNGWSAVSKDLNSKLSLFINFGLALGYLLGLIA